MTSNGNTPLKPALAALLLCLAIPCMGSSDLELKALRDLAISLLKHKNPTSSLAYCEIATTRRTNECSGPDQLEDKLVIRSSGSVEMLTLRSWKEGPDPKPGEYRGRIPLEKWKELLIAISKMAYVKDHRSIPMPGMSQGNTEMILSDGKSTAKYSMVGRGQAKIENAFHEASWLGDSATDTVWTLSLTPLTAKLKNGQLEVQAEWKLSGKSPISISMPANPKDNSCGSTTLAWFHDNSETPGVTPVSVAFEYVKASRSAGGDKWAALDPQTPKRTSLSFSLPAKSKSGPKAGKLVQYGVQVKTTTSGTPLQVTLFSELLSF